jgi:transposase
LNQLLVAMGGELAEADAKLKDTAEHNGGREKDNLAASETKPAKQPPVRRPPPPGLRRVVNPIAVPPEERPCPVCASERACIGHDTTPVIELIPAEVIVRLDQRELLACRNCEAEVVRAPRGDKVVDGGIYGSRLVADLVVGKYWDSVPLNRQGQQLERLGLSMPSSSMADQIRWATELLEPVWLFLMTQVLLSTVMHVDATGIPVKDKDAVGGLTIGSLWGYVGDQSAAVYLYTRTGKRVGQVDGEIGPHDFLARRKGFVVADAAGIFDEDFRRPDLIEIGCNMHARRYFVKALEANDARAAIPIKAFKTLYDVEDDVRGADPERRLQERTSRSKPVYEQLIAWSKTYRPIEPPSSLLGRAMGYLLNHQLALTRFLEDGRLPIDNGIVERLHRRPAVARRNYLFAGSHTGAKRAAIAYSILSTCHLLALNPTEYLADVLPRLSRGIMIARDLPTLTPAAWKAARAAARRAGPVALTVRAHHGAAPAVNRQHARRGSALGRTDTQALPRPRPRAHRAVRRHQHHQLPRARWRQAPRVLGPRTPPARAGRPCRRPRRPRGRAHHRPPVRRRARVHVRR